MTPVIKIDGYQCNRCNHKWVPRDFSKKPMICPNCKSPYWDTPRTRKSKKNEGKK